MLLKGKIAVIYGAGGAIGSGVAEAFAREGAYVHLTGHHLASVTTVAERITSSGLRSTSPKSTRWMRARSHRT